MSYNPNNPNGQATKANSSPVVIASDQDALGVVGNVAAGGTDSGNPVKAGGKYSSTLPTLTDGQRGDLQLDVRGGLQTVITDSNGTGAATVGSQGNNIVTSINGLQTRSTLYGQYDDTSPTAMTEDRLGIPRISANRNMYNTIRDAAGNERGVNVTSANALVVDGSGSTQPVSGTVTANAGTNLNTSALATSANLTAGTAKTQIVDGSGNVIGATGNALDVNIKTNASSGMISTSNSSTANLAGAAAFTGTGEDVTQYSEMRVSVYSSHVSATNGLSIQQSSDNTNWDITDTYTIAATTGKTFVVPRQARYFRVVYTNGATLTTSFRLQTIFNRTSSATSSQRTQDGYTNETDMDQTWAFNSIWNGTTWDRAPGDITNGVDVDVTRLPSLVAGTAVVGKVGIDQTTPGTTNLVSLTSTTITSEIPGTGATNLGKAEDAAHASGDTGVFALAVRNDNLGTTYGADQDYAPIAVDLNSRVMVAQKAATATLSNVAGSATSVTVLAANSARIGATITNDSSALLYVKFGTTASTTSYTVVLAGAASAPFSYYEVPAGYTGRIDGIWASATGNARVTEIS